MDNREFDELARKYFEELVRRFSRALELHKNPGLLFEREFSFGKSWGGVTEHCLMEAARAEIFGGKLKLDKRNIDDLMTAAVLHDFYKRHEIETIRVDMVTGGSGRTGLLRARDASINHLRQAGFSGRVIHLANAVGGQPEELFETKRILDQEDLSDDDIAFLAMHYIDDYTRGSEWVTPVELEGGKMINDVDRRAKKNLSNPDYQKMNDESPILHKGRPFFERKKTFEAMPEISHLVEKRLTQVIESRTGERVEPPYLPEVVDREIKKKIEKFE